MNKQRNHRSFVPVIMKDGTSGKIDTSTLPKKDWMIHSGPAKVAAEDVHSLTSQKIQGTNNLVIQAENGVKLCVTDGEAELFAIDHLVNRLGYTVKAPTA